MQQQVGREEQRAACSHIVLSSWWLIYKHSACLLVSVSRRFNGINYPSVLTAADTCVVCNTPSFDGSSRSLTGGETHRGARLCRNRPQMQNNGKEGGAARSHGASQWRLFGFDSAPFFEPFPSHIRSLLGSYCSPSVHEGVSCAGCNHKSC